LNGGLSVRSNARRRAGAKASGFARYYWGFEPIGNGQAPGITTGRGAAGAGAAGLRAAGLRFAGARFALRRAAFFFAARFLPARLFDLAI
jgi:hypothetical protein